MPSTKSTGKIYESTLVNIVSGRAIGENVD